MDWNEEEEHKMYEAEEDLLLEERRQRKQMRGGLGASSKTRVLDWLVHMLIKLRSRKIKWRVETSFLIQLRSVTQKTEIIYCILKEATIYFKVQTNVCSYIYLFLSPALSKPKTQIGGKCSINCDPFMEPKMDQNGLWFCWLLLRRCRCTAAPSSNILLKFSSHLSSGANSVFSAFFVLADSDAWNRSQQKRRVSSAQTAEKTTTFHFWILLLTTDQESRQKQT